MDDCAAMKKKLDAMPPGPDKDSYQAFYDLHCGGQTNDGPGNSPPPTPPSPPPGPGDSDGTG